jgi:hypothetical protein
MLGGMTFKIVLVLFGLGFWPSPLRAASPPESCGNADPAYIRTANETGGIPMFLQRSEAGKAFHLVRETTRNNISTALWATGSLDQPQTLDIPVDSVTQRLTFAFSFDKEAGSVGIASPGGRAASQAMENAEITDLHCGKIVTIVSPEAGNWHVELSGSGHFWAQAEVQSDIYFVRTEFVRNGGRPGHEGLFRIEGQPVAGRKAMIRVSLSSAATRSVEFYLVGERGEMIQTLQMRPVSSDREEFVGTVDVPNSPFRVAMSGLDSNGKKYQRFYAGLFHGETVEVVWNRVFDEVPAGASRKVEFIIHNGSVPRTFTVIVTDAHQFVTNVEPREMTLGSGESRTVLVELTVPVGTRAGIGDDVVIVASSTTGPPTSNSSVAHFSTVAQK